MRSWRRIFVAYLAVSLISATVLGITALHELFLYSPYENPGAGQAGFRLGIAAIAVISIPAALIIVLVACALVRDYKRMTAGLTRGQRMALMLTETAGLFAAHEAWKHHNEEESARLTGSVMGGDHGSGTEE
jgi:hypothetical protein